MDFLTGNDLQDAEAELFDITGKLLLKQHLENSEASIHIKDLSPGVITIKITGAFETGIHKIIKR